MHKKTPIEQHVAFYIRVSDPKQAEGADKSPASQKERTQRYWEQRFPDCKLPQIFYCDVKSAASDDRVEYQKLIANIKAGKVFAVVATEISRLSRSVIHFAQLVELCKQHHVQIHCLVQNFDSSTNTGWLSMMLFATMAQFERQQISERTAANIQSRARRGLSSGGIALGYKSKIGMSGYLDVVPEEAVIVRLIFEKYLELGSYSQVATWLNVQGIKSHYNKLWTPSRVLYVLQNPTYISKRYIGNELVPAVWESIIESDLWQEVNDRLQRDYKQNRVSFKASGHVWIFSNLLYCPHCGVKLQNTCGTSKSGAVYYYYRHRSCTQKKDCPLPNYIDAVRLDTELYDAIAQIINDEQQIEATIAAAFQNINTDLNTSKAKLLRTTKALDALEKEVQTLLSQMLSLSSDQIQEFIQPRLQAISDEKKHLATEIQTCQHDILLLESQTLTTNQVKEMLIALSPTNFPLSPAKQKMAIRSVVEKVDLTANRIAVYLITDETQKGWLTAAECSTNYLQAASAKSMLNTSRIVFPLSLSEGISERLFTHT